VSRYGFEGDPEAQHGGLTVTLGYKCTGVEDERKGKQRLINMSVLEF
jgi:hypothetical protein